jgi:hypothetical protein
LNPRKIPWTANIITFAGAPRALNERKSFAGLCIGETCINTSMRYLTATGAKLLIFVSSSRVIANNVVEKAI